MSDIGHNSDGAYSVTASELRSFIERIEHLLDEKRDIAEQIKEVKAEAKTHNYDTKAINTLIQMRAKEREQLAEEMAILKLYGDALGMEIFQ